MFLSLIILLIPRKTSCLGRPSSDHPTYSLNQCFSNHGSRPKIGSPRLCGWVAKAYKLPRVKEIDPRAQEPFFLEITTSPYAQTNLFGSQSSLQIVVFSNFGSPKKGLRNTALNCQDIAVRLTILFLFLVFI